MYFYNSISIRTNQLLYNMVKAFLTGIGRINFYIRRFKFNFYIIYYSVGQIYS